MFDYSTQANNDSMFNTPATLSWYVAGCVFEWIKEQGGLSVMAKLTMPKRKHYMKLLITLTFTTIQFQLNIAHG